MLIPTCIIKVLELALACACLVLFQLSYDLTNVPLLMLCAGTYVGYIVVLSGEVIAELMCVPLDLIQDMFFGLVGMVLFFACGAASAAALRARAAGAAGAAGGDALLPALQAALAFAVGFVMLLDLTLAYLDSEEID